MSADTLKHSDAKSANFTDMSVSTPCAKNCKRVAIMTVVDGARPRAIDLTHLRISSMRIAIATLITLLLYGTGANAACVQSDLAGRWNLYSYDGWGTRCMLFIDTYGKISNASCYVYDYNTNTVTKLPATGGTLSLAVATRCAFKGMLTLYYNNFIVPDLTISKDKSVANGLMSHSNYGNAFTFSMTKY